MHQIGANVVCQFRKQCFALTFCEWPHVAGKEAIECRTMKSVRRRGGAFAENLAARDGDVDRAVFVSVRQGL